MSEPIATMSQSEADSLILNSLEGARKNKLKMELELKITDKVIEFLESIKPEIVEISEN